jgi:xanthine dehydrogenase YagR molybdenum-binding subunit
MTDIAFRLNGAEVTACAGPGTALDLIRDVLGLTGAKLVCGTGGCGACAVLVDGMPAETCVLPTEGLAGREVVTVEGLAGPAGLHPVQRALLAHDAVQCGFCTPGVVVGGVAFVERWRREHPGERPTAREVAEALDGHLCRCGAYPGIISAVRAACSGEFDGDDPVPARPEAPLKATGAARYTVDVRLESMLHGRIVRSTEPRAEILAVETDAAMAIPGVRAIVELLPPDRTVRYVGDSIAAVAAVDVATAERAIQAIAVRYRALASAVGMAAAMADGAPDLVGWRLMLNSSNEAGAFAVALPRSGNRRGPWSPLSYRRITARRRIARAQRSGDPLLVEGTWVTAAQSHASPEPHTAVADWKGDSLTVYLSSQSVTATAARLARRYGLEPARVRVVADHVGGAFGSKQGLTEPVVEAVELSRAAGAPVRVSLSPTEELSVTGYRPGSEIRLSLLGGVDGSLQAVEAVAHLDGGDSVGQTVANLMRLSYPGRPMALVDYDVVNNAPPAKPFHAPGSPMALFALETAVDELAERLGDDPIALRLGWAPRPLRRAVYEWAASHPLWRGRPQAAGKAVGVGVAFGTWYYGYDPATRVRVLADPSGFAVETAAQEIGTGARTLLAAGVAEVFGVSPDGVTVRIGDSALCHGPTTSASRTTPSLAPTTREAAVRLRDRLVESATHELGLVGAVPVEGGVVHDGELVLWSELLRRIAPQSAEAKRPKDRHLPVSPVPVEGVQAGWGLSDSACLVEVTVDRASGAVRATRAAVALAAGKIHTPVQAAGQVHGALARGIGQALTEERITDPRTGRVVTASYDTYRILRCGGMPEVEVHFVEEGFEHAPGGGAGIAELAITAVPAAVANAVAHATGRRLRRLPMTPERVREALAV